MVKIKIFFFNSLHFYTLLFNHSLHILFFSLHSLHILFFSLHFIRRTFGHQTELPITTSEAIAQKWVAVSNCEADLGILYTKDKSGPTEKHPLGLRFTASGKIAGIYFLTLFFLLLFFFFFLSN